MRQVISRCPVCGGQLKAIKLGCETCHTVIENKFILSKFDYLSPEELYFTETFIKCRGNIKEVEKELNISYPTVRARLDSVIKALGYEDNETEEREKTNRQLVLSALEHGEISVEEAISKLR